MYPIEISSRSFYAKRETFEKSASLPSRLMEYHRADMRKPPHRPISLKFTIFFAWLQGDGADMERIVQVRAGQVLAHNN
jgi:hypothetical protein